MNISIDSYSQNTPQANCMMVTIDNMNLWFSYNTIVAFRAPGFGLVVRQNDWGTTTGKHINWIDGGNKKRRLPSKEFEEKLSLALAKREQR